jgi:NADPH2:quinone reductase
MRALLLENFGDPMVMREVPMPIAAPGEVLVRVAASGVNPLDVKIHAGLAAHAKVALPATLGLDLAGTVEAVGPGVDVFAIGDDVFGLTGGVGTLPGSLSEYVAVDARLLAKKPHVLSMREAAALPLAVVTAWEGLVDRAAIAAGQQVLIHGGAGGVGNICIQLAVALGATTFATGSADQLELIARYGATPIDRTLPVADYVAAHAAGDGFDIVYDTVGGSVLDASFQAVRIYTGRVVSCLGWGTHSLAPLSFRGASYSGVFTLLPMLTGSGRAHHGAILGEAATLADRGLLRPRVDPAIFSLDTANAAHARLAAGSEAGKVVVEIG